MSRPEAWQLELARAHRDPRRLAERLGRKAWAFEEVSALYPLMVPAGYLELCEAHGQELLRQVLPEEGELADDAPADHLGEEATSPAPAVLRRFGDRVALLVTHACAVACRFCNRKSRFWAGGGLPWAEVKEGLAYIESRREVREVLVSGGDPLILEDRRLASVLGRLRSIPHVETLRVGTRVPVVLPSRITPRLCRLLGRGRKPLWLVAHINHPMELEPREVAGALRRLAGSGVPLLAQTVLLKGVNDDPDVLEALYWALAARGVQPYYLFHAEGARGTGPFQMPLDEGRSIVGEALRRLPAELRPTYVVDEPSGKRPLLE
jgi:lysine 2,3-aminomutase